MEANNIKEMREALERISKQEELFHRHLNNDQYARAEDAIEFLSEASEAAKAALSAHPRNCDRFATEEECYQYWRTHVKASKEPGWFDIDGKSYPYILPWLFDEAAQEGDSNENK